MLAYNFGSAFSSSDGTYTGSHRISNQFTNWQSSRITCLIWKIWAYKIDGMNNIIQFSLAKVILCDASKSLSWTPKQEHCSMSSHERLISWLNITNEEPLSVRIAEANYVRMHKDISYKLFTSPDSQDTIDSSNFHNENQSNQSKIKLWPIRWGYLYQAIHHSFLVKLFWSINVNGLSCGPCT